MDLPTLILSSDTLGGWDLVLDVTTTTWERGKFQGWAVFKPNLSKYTPPRKAKWKQGQLPIPGTSSEFRNESDYTL